MAVVGPKFSHVKVITRDRLVDILESVSQVQNDFGQPRFPHSPMHLLC